MTSDSVSAVRAYLLGLQASIVGALQAEDGQPFRSDAWTRSPGGPLQGDGSSQLLEEGAFLERGGCNFSHVKGAALPPSATQHRAGLTGAPFEALGSAGGEGITDDADPDALGHSLWEACRAQARPRRHLTLIHKTNVLTHAGSLWSRTVEEVSAEFPEVTVAYQHVDAASMFFVTDPGRFDVIVTDNLFGDIVTDLAAAVTGGIGLAASGNLDASGTNPSMFEPVHGSAPDIAGKGVADPTATVLSVGLLLDHLGRADQARKVNAAVAFDLSTRDPEAQVRTEDVGDRLAALTGG